MIRLRYRDDDSSASGMLFLAAGALAGLAVGVLVAQRFGGFSGVGTAVRSRLGRGLGDTGSVAADADEFEGEDDEIEDEPDEYAADAGEELEERVLEAFRNDPVLGERAIDIGAVGDDIIELTGWVHTADESDHARTVAGGVPGVHSVINRLDVREDEEAFSENARRVAEGDPALTEAQWEGQHVGTGRRRQGTSAELDRHADPRTELEDRWLSTEEAIRAAADDPADITTSGNRRTGKRGRRGDRAGGAPVAPTGVPKADHVADPEQAAEPERAD